MVNKYVLVLGSGSIVAFWSDIPTMDMFTLFTKFFVVTSIMFVLPLDS